MKSGDVSDFVAKIVAKAVKEDKALHETPNNRISGGRVGSDYSYSFYNPHNARFYFVFSKWNFKPSIDFVPINSGAELKLESFAGCRFVVKKRLVEVTNLIDSVRRFTVSGSDSDRGLAVLEAQAILEREAIKALRSFVSLFGGACDFVCVKRHVPDNKVLHDEIIDSLDLDITWNDDVSKKVYKTRPLNVEYKKPVYSQNYFRNAGLRAFAPEIADGLVKIDDDLLVFRRDALDPLTEQIRLHLEVQRETLSALKGIQSFYAHLGGSPFREAGAGSTIPGFGSPSGSGRVSNPRNVIALPVNYHANVIDFLKRRLSKRRRV